MSRFKIAPKRLFLFQSTFNTQQGFDDFDGFRLDALKFQLFNAYRDKLSGAILDNCNLIFRYFTTNLLVVDHLWLSVVVH